MRVFVNLRFQQKRPRHAQALGISLMDSPLARVILATLGGYLILLFFLFVHGWFFEEYPQRPTEPTKSGRIQHPFFLEEVAKALQRFSRLTKGGQRITTLLQAAKARKKRH